MGQSCPAVPAEKNGRVQPWSAKQPPDNTGGDWTPPSAAHHGTDQKSHPMANKCWLSSTTESWVGLLSSNNNNRLRESSLQSLFFLILWLMIIMLDMKEGHGEESEWINRYLLIHYIYNAVQSFFVPGIFQTFYMNYLS